MCSSSSPVRIGTQLAGVVACDARRHVAAVARRLPGEAGARAPEPRAPPLARPAAGGCGTRASPGRRPGASRRGTAARRRRCPRRRGRGRPGPVSPRAPTAASSASATEAIRWKSAKRTACCSSGSPSITTSASSHRPAHASRCSASSRSKPRRSASRSARERGVDRGFPRSGRRVGTPADRGRGARPGRAARCRLAAATTPPCGAVDPHPSGPSSSAPARRRRPGGGSEGGARTEGRRRARRPGAPRSPAGRARTKRTAATRPGSGVRLVTSTPVRRSSMRRTTIPDRASTGSGSIPGTAAAARLRPVAVVQPRRQDSGRGRRVRSERAPARPEPAVGECQEGLVHPLELRVQAFDREDPGRVLVELGNRALGPTPKLVLEHARGRSPARRRGRSLQAARPRLYARRRRPSPCLPPARA